MPQTRATDQIDPDLSGDLSGVGARLDKWLWHARFFKSRSLAGALCRSGLLRLNGIPVSKPSVSLRPGNVLSFPYGKGVRVLRVLAIGTRCGPATEARMLYAEITEPPLGEPQGS